MGLYTTNFLLESNSIPEADLNDHSTKLQQLYIAYFGRAGAPGGLDYWVSEGVSTKEFAAIMYAQPEFNSVNAGLSTKQQINQIYLNLFNRGALEGGLNYWASEIDSGRLQLASIANDLIYNVYHPDGNLEDRLVMDNKVNAAIEYTSQISASAQTTDAYVADSIDPWVTGDALEEAISFMSSIDANNQATASDVADSITNFRASSRYHTSLEHYESAHIIEPINDFHDYALGLLPTIKESSDEFLLASSNSIDNQIFFTDTIGLG